MGNIIKPVEKMSKRERFLNVFEYRDLDHIPDVEFGYWEETLKRWHNDGLPRWVIDDTKAQTFFGLEGRKTEISVGEKIPLGILFGPPIDLYESVVPFDKFKSEILREDDRKRVLRDEAGLVSIQWKAGAGTSIPEFLQFPVKNKESWNDYKDRFDLDGIRYPENWEELKERYEERSYPLGVSGGGYFGWARHLMGLERFSITFYRDPDLIRDMFKFRTEMVLRAIGKAVREVKPTIDFAHWWEDMCYNKGPLLSPKLFKEFMVPEYKRVTSFLKDHGIWINILDCDRDINSLVPLWLDAGINCMFPLEVNAGSDPAELREKFGRRVLLMGGFDKLALIKGKKATEMELERLKPLIEEGGYIPHVDHRVPADVSYEDYLYYLANKRKIIFQSSSAVVPDYYYEFRYRETSTQAL